MATGLPRRGLGRRLWSMRAPLGVAVGGAIACAGCGAAAAARVAGPSTAQSSQGGASATTTTTTTAPPHAMVGPFHFSSNDFKIDSTAPSEVVTAQITIHPAASSGWHTHPGPVFVIVTAGTITRYQVGSDGTCTSASYGVGEGFVEPPGQVHIARNQGTTDAMAVATYLDVPPGTTAIKTAVPAPAACPGIG